MAETHRCPQCGKQLPPDAPAGLCPACLLQQGREGESARDMPLTTPRPERFIPPSREELARQFPQLEILELLGTGGMGAVYKVRQPQLDRLAALKILPPELGRDPAFEQRFTREARALARLGHPNIVAVYDFGQAGAVPGAGEGEAPAEPSRADDSARPDSPPSGEDSLYYLLMEYVDGTNLRELIQHGKLQPEEALAIVPQICEALQYAHDEGVVHRDIKPENILVDKRGGVKIADFGLAKIAGRPAAGEAAAVGKQWTLTETGQVMGTQHYMAPEQLKGSHQVDHRADIYSLGVVFYEMLTGELPIGRFEPPSKKVRVDVRLDEVVLRALENEPARRYQQASEVKTDVERVSRAGEPPPPTLPAVEPIPADLEESILSHLPQNFKSAMKLYRAKTGAGVDQAVMAVEAIAQRHGIEFPPIPLRRYLAGYALVTVMFAIMGTGYFLFFKYVHLSSIITGTVYYVLMAGITAYLAVSAWRYRRYRGTRRYQGMLLVAVVFGICFLILPVAGLLLGFLAEPEPVLNWLYRVSGAKPGEHDVFFLHTLLAVIILGTLAWLIRFWFKLRARSRASDKGSAAPVGPRLGRQFARRLVAAAIMASVMVIIAALSYFYRSGPSPWPSGVTATVRKIPMTEAERDTPGLSVYRYELKLPKGYDAEFSTELWRHGKPEESRIHLAGCKARNGRVELRLQQGETSSPEGKGKLRWDWRADNAPVEIGDWIDDPFAGAQVQFSSERSDQWQLTPRKEYTVMILLGWKQRTAAGVVPPEYFDAPTDLAKAIRRGKIPRADVELYLKVRIRPEAPHATRPNSAGTKSAKPAPNAETRAKGRPETPPDKSASQ